MARVRSASVMRDLFFKDFWTAARVREMKISAAPSGMPRALAVDFKSLVMDFSVALSIGDS